MRCDELPALRDPSVSIVICNYNYGRFLEQALESALHQTYRCEVVVVDDGSTDDSRKILESYGQRVTVVLQPNSGQRAAYNAGFSHCSGEVVIFLDSDDYLEANAAATVAMAFEAGVAKVHYLLSLVDESGRSLEATIPSTLAEGNMLEDLLRRGLLYASAPGSGNAYRRRVLEQLFPLPTSPVDRVAADFFVIYGSAALGEVRAIRASLGSYRLQESALVADAVAFGNAVQRVDEHELFARIYAEFHDWLSARTDGTRVPPKRLLDFSRIKAKFVREILLEPYFRGVVGASRQLPELLTALWLRREYSLAFKGAMSGWALVVLLFPRPLGRPVARYVGNPASRRDSLWKHVHAWVRRQRQPLGSKNER